MAKLFIQLGIEPNAHTFRLETSHDAFSVTRCTNFSQLNCRTLGATPKQNDGWLFFIA